jgi:hypothetical protein
MINEEKILLTLEQLLNKKEPTILGVEVNKVLTALVISIIIALGSAIYGFIAAQSESEHRINKVETCINQNVPKIEKAIEKDLLVPDDIK